MRSIVEAFGVDYIQWRALVWMHVRFEFAGPMGTLGAAKAVKGIAVLMLGVIFYGMAGIFAAIVIARNPDPLAGGTLLATIVMFMTGFLMLMNDASRLIAPSDYAILAFRPITPRTYLVVRLTVILVSTLQIATFTGFIPVVTAFVARGPAVGVAAIVAVYGASFFTTMSIAAFYGSLLRWVGSDRLTRLLGYVQMLMGFVLYGGFGLVTAGIGSNVVSSARLPEWLLILPVTWFGSYLTLAAGHVTPAIVAAACASIVTTTMAVASLGGKFSIDYSEQLSSLAMAARPAREDREPSRWQGFLRHETLVVALLLRAHFRNDQQFRMSVFALVPITVIYMFMGTHQAELTDPFLHHASGFGFTQLIVMFLPSTLRRSILTSQSYRASWIFRTTPANKTQLITSTTTIVALFFLVPYLAFLAATLDYAIHNIAHAILHACFLGLVAHLILQITMIIDPALPFSRPVTKRDAASTFGPMFGFMIGGMLVIQVGTWFFYQTPLRLAILFTMLIGLTIAMHGILQRRVNKIEDSLAIESET